MKIKLIALIALLSISTEAIKLSQEPEELTDPKKVAAAADAVAKTKEAAESGEEK